MSARSNINVPRAPFGFSLVACKPKMLTVTCSEKLALAKYRSSTPNSGVHHLELFCTEVFRRGGNTKHEQKAS